MRTCQCFGCALVLVLGSACGDDDGGNQNNNDNGNAAGVCGNGALEGQEECDDGAENSDIAPDACRTDCRIPWCGDGVTDAGELCDEGSGNSDRPGAPCRRTCGLPTCGDGVLDPGEQCDDGPENSDCEPDACRLSCALPRCGDGVVDPTEGEVCDGSAGQCFDCERPCDDCDGDGYGSGAGCPAEDCDDEDPLIHAGCDQTCGPATCPQGCCVGDACVTFAHQNLDHCGAGGLACTACALSQTCDAEGQCAGEVVLPKMFYTRGDYGNDLYAANLDGTEETSLASDAFAGGVGGGKLCFSNGTSIVVMNLDGTGRTTVPNTDDAGLTAEVDCAADGTALAYTGGLEHRYLYLIDLDGTNKVMFHSGDLMYQFPTTPSWNVSGYLVFGLYGMGYPEQEYVQRKDIATPMAEATALTETVGRFAASGGPFGKIVYSDENGNLIVIDSDGSNPTQLLTPGADTTTGTKAWVPGEDVILYVRGGDIWSVRGDDTDNHQVTTLGDIDLLYGVE